MDTAQILKQMKTRIVNILSPALIVLPVSFDVSKAQKRNVEYVNTFIGPAPLTDPKFLGYELQKGWSLRTMIILSPGWQKSQAILPTTGS